MTISLPITALVASAMLLHPTTAHPLFGDSQIGDYNLFTQKIHQGSTSLEVGGKIAIEKFTALSRDATLTVGQQIKDFDGQCPNTIAPCPLEDLIKLGMRQETVFYSEEVPWSQYTSATVYNGIAYHCENMTGNTSYTGIPGWTFDTVGCGPNKLYDLDFMDFRAQMAEATMVSHALNPTTDHGTGTQYLDGAFCHENKLLVIPDLSNVVVPAGKRPIVRYNLTCAQFNDMKNYEIFDRNTNSSINPILSFTFDGDVVFGKWKQNTCWVTTADHPIFKGREKSIVWNFIGDALRFQKPGTFYGTFIAAAEDKVGAIFRHWHLQLTTPVTFHGQVISKQFLNFPAVINLAPLADN